MHTPLDVWAGTQPAYTETNDPLRAPVRWHALNRETRAAIGGAAIALLAEEGTALTLRNADTPRLAHELWRRVRFAGDVEQDLKRSKVVAPIALLELVLQKLLAAGDVLTTLRQLRSGLDERIEAIETARGNSAAIIESIEARCRLDHARVERLRAGTSGLTDAEQGAA